MADRQHARIAATLVLVGVVTFAVHRLGILFYSPQLGMAVVWPGSGVWLAMMLLTPRRLWTATLVTILGVALVTNLIVFRSFGPALGYLASNAIEIGLGARTLQRWRGHTPSFTRVADVLALIFVATVINGLSSLPGAWAGTLHSSVDFEQAYVTWWTADALAILLLTPFVVTWVRGGRERLRTMPQSGMFEGVAFSFVWCLATWLTFRASDGGSVAPYSYVLVCLLAWAGLRHGVRLMATSIVVLGAIALQVTLLSGDMEQLTHTQLYLAIAATTGFLLVTTSEERRAAEAATLHAEERLRLAVQSARLGAWIWDIERDHIQWSDEVGNLFRVDPTTFGHNYEAYLALIHPDDRKNVAAGVQRALDGEIERFNIEHRIVGPGGKVYWLEGVGRVFRDAHDRPIRMAGTVFDITDRKLLEEQLRRAQKMEALGQLAGGVAHDFNNTLAAIMMQAEACRTDERPREVTECLSEIIAAAQRAVNLTRQLLTFSRRNVMQLRVSDLNDLVRELGSMLDRIVGEHVRMKLELHDKPLVIKADPGLIDQVLMNLVVNSRDAMPHGGRLVVQTAETLLDEENTRSLVDVAVGRYASLRVTDTGIGIPSEDLDHLFEPFFTTKPVGQGTGLGLPTVFGIVKQHGGHIRVESELGRGTTIEVLLPLSTTEVPIAVTHVPTVRARGGTETILLVEDDSLLRRSTAAILRRHGYRVLEAANGAEALALFETTRDRIQLVFTDVVMPEGISGFDLAARLVARQPDLQVIFTSGYSAEVAGPGIELVPGHNFLQKPSPAQQILETIRKRLD